MAATIAYLFHKRKRIYGSPRTTADLHAMGWRVLPNTVAALMHEQGLVARPKRRRRGTTRPDKSGRKAPDLLRRDFTPREAPNVAWVGDLTEIPTDEGKLHLASVIDLHSRRVPGFAMDIPHDAALARAALCMAIAVRGGSVAGVIFHTGRGGEYTGEIFAQACRGAGVTQSMGRTGSALDNAVAESFNSTLEWELLRDNHFHTREEARHAVAAWIDDDNSQRRHSTNEMLSPIDYERTCTPAADHQPRCQTSPGAGGMTPEGGGCAAAVLPGRVPRQATGPPLRPQGPLPRSLHDGPTARP